MSHLVGPCFVGPGTHVLGGRIRPGTSLGPHCRVGGEVEASIVQGYSNKAHDGFLGHSFVGEWVNLAAGTHTGDLRNDYGTISVPADGVNLNTGRVKVGSFVGDHARTGLGVLLNCGSVVGAFAAVLPTGRLAPRDVPSFTRHGPDGFAEDLDLIALFATADTMMRRRGRSLSRAQDAVYRAVAAQTAAHRRRALGGRRADAKPEDGISVIRGGVAVRPAAGPLHGPEMHAKFGWCGGGQPATPPTGSYTAPYPPPNDRTTP